MFAVISLKISALQIFIKHYHQNIVNISIFIGVEYYDIKEIKLYSFSNYVFLAFGISYLPPFGQVTPFGMKAIAVFISVLYRWIFFDLFWTSIYGFMIIPVLRLNTVAGAFAAGLGNQMIITVMLSMAFAEKAFAKKSLVFSFRFIDYRCNNRRYRTINGSHLSFVGYCFKNS